MELNTQHCFNVLNIPVEKIFQIEQVKADVPSYSRLLDSHICLTCGEKVMDTKAVKKGDAHYCAKCGGGVYGQLDWSGISLVTQKG